MNPEKFVLLIQSEHRYFELQLPDLGHRYQYHPYQLQPLLEVLNRDQQVKHLHLIHILYKNLGSNLRLDRYNLYLCCQYTDTHWNVNKRTDNRIV